MSFLEKEEARSSSGIWDWVIGIGLIVLIVGFTAYYQYEKKASTNGFDVADSLFVAGDYRMAAEKYEELKEAQYLTPEADSLIYARLDSIRDIQEQDIQVIRDAQERMAQGDSLTAKNLLAAHRFRHVIGKGEQEQLDSMLRQLALRP